MLKRFVRLALCSSLLLGAASAISAQDIIKQANAQIAASMTIKNVNGKTVVVRSNGSNQAPRAPRPGPSGSSSTSSSSSVTTTSNGTSSSVSQSTYCDDDGCTAVINGVTYGPYAGSSLTISNNEIVVDGKVVQKF